MPSGKLLTVDEDGVGCPALRHYRRLAIPDKTSLDLHVLQFEEALFDARAFHDFRITMPDQIARSVRRRQAEFLFGRLGARLALAQHGSADIEVAVGPRGEPVWPSGFIGSITHSGKHAAAMVLPKRSFRGIGIDIEQTVNPDAEDAVEQLVLLPDERELLRGLPCRYQLLLALVFSAKESFYKAVNAVAGGYFGFELMRVMAIDLECGRIAFSVMGNVCADWPKGSQGELGFLELEEGVILTHFLW
jgi:4'-phosphopantetheinyl transferase EntD